MRPDVFSHKLLTKSVAAMVNNVGFSHISESSLSILTGIADAFLDGIARCCAAHTELGNRSLPAMCDILLATEQMGVELYDLWEYIFSVSSFPMMEVPCFPIDTQRKEDFLIHPEMSPPALEELLEESRAREKEKEQLGIMEASEFFDPSTVDREQKAKSNFPNFFGLTAQSLGIRVEKVGIAPSETMDISLDSLASPIMAIRKPFSKVRESKLKKKEEKKKKKNVAPPATSSNPKVIQTLVGTNRRVLEIRSETTKLKILLPPTPKEVKQVLNTAKENTVHKYLEPKTPCQPSNLFRVEHGSGLKLRILKNVPRNE